MALINWHVLDQTNVGDLLSAPTRYLSFPGAQQADFRQITSDFPDKISDAIIGGGGLLFDRFAPSFTTLQQINPRGKLIAWGIGQQIYGNITPTKISQFDYRSYLDGFDLVGVRDAQIEDLNLGYHWVPCASCLHPAFDRSRKIEHEFVIFSHKKFQIDVPNFPRLSNSETDFEKVLDFLGSGETILTSSYHGAYWGTLLGRKVLAFPFSSKIHTLKHLPAIFPVQRWSMTGFHLKLLGKTIIDRRDKNRLSCDLTGWQNFLKDCRTYPESLQQCRDRNHWFYDRVTELISPLTN